MKLRIKYEITEAGRYLGHLDLTRTIMKTLRRAELPVMLSEGFNPHPRLSFALPLPVGHTGLAEYFEVIMAQEISEKDFIDIFNQYAPQAIKILEAKEIKEKSDSLASMINAAIYQVDFYETDCQLLKEVTEEILALEELIILKRSKKKTRETDIRSLIFAIETNYLEDCCRLRIFLAHGSKDNLRPLDLLNVYAEKGINTEKVSLTRLGLFLKDGEEYHDLMNIYKSVGSL